MPVNIDTTGRKYHGRMAETYETKRKKQQRWDIENEVVEKMLTKLAPKTVLDVPCGTGRFLPVYEKLKVKSVIAMDISDSMIALAKEKLSKVKSTRVDFIRRDVRRLKPKYEADVSVCVRFLDLIDEKAMYEVLAKLMERSKVAIICTIRLGPEYVPKTNTATHNERKFKKFLEKNEWKIAKSHAVFTQGWFIFLLKPNA